ncbi:MAG: beta-ketoacyl-[acyl-carrier-protein] synthase family protein [bacterium]|nr:beta-ketoacyl-[acyl-carrier-protein] synthase family protein [bacterium]
MSDGRRAVVTGLGVVTPVGSDAPAFWGSLVEGRRGAAEVRSFETSELPNKRGCEVDEFELDSRIRDRLLGGRCTELGAAALSQAVAQAGVADRIAGRGNAAIVVGTTMGEVTQFEQDRAAHADREPDAEDVRSLVHRPLDVMARSLAHAYDLVGDVVTVPAACAAGSYAVGVAASMVNRGDVPLALAVGCEAFSRLAFVGFTRMHAMSSDLCRPFSLDRPGLLLGEGAGALVIEAEEVARSRGAEPLGYVDGFGLSCDAYHITGPHPEAEGATRAIRDALTRARVNPDDVDYVNAHGTGTPLNDKIESLAVNNVFGERAGKLPVSSIKALTGHMLGAAGAVEAVASLLAMRHGVIPPTWNWIERDPECAVDCVPNEPREATLSRVVSNSYAFGGNNASLLLTSPAAG